MYPGYARTLKNGRQPVSVVQDDVGQVCLHILWSAATWNRQGDPSITTREARADPDVALMTPRGRRGDACGPMWLAGSRSPQPELDGQVNIQATKAGI